MVGVVLRLHRFFFCLQKEKCLRKVKFVMKKVNKYDIIKLRLHRWEGSHVENKL